MTFVPKSGKRIHNKPIKGGKLSKKHKKKCRKPRHVAHDADFEYSVSYDNLTEGDKMKCPFSKDLDFFKKFSAFEIHKVFMYLDKLTNKEEIVIADTEEEQQKFTTDNIDNLRQFFTILGVLPNLSTEILVDAYEIQWAMAIASCLGAYVEKPVFYFENAYFVAAPPKVITTVVAQTGPVGAISHTAVVEINKETGEVKGNHVEETVMPNPT